MFRCPLLCCPGLFQYHPLHCLTSLPSPWLIQREKTPSYLLPPCQLFFQCFTFTACMSSSNLQSAYNTNARYSLSHTHTHTHQLISPSHLTQSRTFFVMVIKNCSREITLRTSAIDVYKCGKTISVCCIKMRGGEGRGNGERDRLEAGKKLSSRLELLVGLAYRTCLQDLLTVKSTTMLA